LLISYHLLGLKYKKESEQNGNRRNKKNWKKMARLLGKE
jgi:hypothetical protein